MHKIYLKRSALQRWQKKRPHKHQPVNFQLHLKTGDRVFKGFGGHCAIVKTAEGGTTWYDVR